jgi:hypothetical protein
MQGGGSECGEEGKAAENHEWLEETAEGCGRASTKRGFSVFAVGNRPCKFGDRYGRISSCKRSLI